jgi:hypothetical protein
MRLSLCVTYVGAIAILFGRVSSPVNYIALFINVIPIWSYNFRFRFSVLIARPSVRFVGVKTEIDAVVKL